jgi:hypothetical protein
MENHKQMLDKEYEQLLQQFSKELEKLQLKHHQDLDRKVGDRHGSTLLRLRTFIAFVFDL